MLPTGMNCEFPNGDGQPGFMATEVGALAHGFINFEQYNIRLRPSCDKKSLKQFFYRTIHGVATISRSK